MTGFNVGDKGQRYEVRAKTDVGKTMIVGWTEIKEDADSMAKGIELHPCLHSPKVIDRQAMKERK